jgi:hypothetical protein
MRFEYYTSRTSCSTFEPQFILRETDIYLTNDIWRIAVDFNLSMYHDVISTVTTDLFTLEHQKQEFTSISDLKHTFATLETRLYDFYHFLPRLDRSQSLLDLGGTVLRTLFEQ